MRSSMAQFDPVDFNCTTAQAHAAIERSDFPFLPHFGHGGFLNTIVPVVKKISSCHVLPQTGQSNFRGEIETVVCITGFDDRRREKSRRLFAFNFCRINFSPGKILRLIFIVENLLIAMFPADGLTLHSGGCSRPSPVRLAPVDFPDLQFRPWETCFKSNDWATLRVRACFVLKGR